MLLADSPSHRQKAGVWALKLTPIETQPEITLAAPQAAEWNPELKARISPIPKTQCPPHSPRLAPDRLWPRTLGSPRQALVLHLPTPCPGPSILSLTLGSSEPLLPATPRASQFRDAPSLLWANSCPSPKFICWIWNLSMIIPGDRTFKRGN